MHEEKEKYVSETFGCGDLKGKSGHKQALKTQDFHWEFSQI